MEEIGYLMVQIFILLFLAEAFGKLFKRIGLPEIVGQIVAGFVFVNLTIYTDLGDLIDFDMDVIEADSNNFLNVMGQLGLVFLLFGIGLETKLSDLSAIGRKALTIAAFGILFPFVGGFAVYFLFNSDVSGAIMCGTAIFAMSTVVCVELLRSFGILDAPVGRMVVGIAIFSDILCLILLAVNMAIVQPVNGGAVVVDIAIILVFVFLMFLFIGRAKLHVGRLEGFVERTEREIDLSHRDLLVLSVVICLGFTALSYVVGLSGIVGAFLAGMYLAETEKISHIKESFDTLTKFLLPFFFIYVGLRLRLDTMSSMALIIGLVLAMVAVATKFAGGYVGCRVCSMENGTSKFIASCMVARGDIAIVVATLALSAGIFDVDFYAAIIIMAVITQLSSVFLMKKMYPGMETSPSSGRGSVSDTD